MNTESVLFALIRVAVCGESATEQLKTACTDEMLQKVNSLAAHHDLLHLIGQGISKMNLPDCPSVQIAKKAAMTALYRNIRMESAYRDVCDVLEEHEVPFLPLKGSVLRHYYPEGWMRTSCDMDILVPQEMLEKAGAVLKDVLHYSLEGKTSHDIAFQTPAGDILELHYSLIEDFVSSPSERILSYVWEKAQPVFGKTYHKEIPDDLFYYYHIAHMAKHFVHGGCGIRPFLDIWVLNHRKDPDLPARKALLEEGQMLSFAEGAEKLSRIWFSGESYDAMSRNMEQFLLSGGTYGSLENRVIVNQSKAGGKLSYALKRIFLPYDVIKHYYPVLQKHKWLTPFYQILRWFKLLFCGGVKRSARELQVNAQTPRESENTTINLLRYLGLTKVEGEGL